MAVKKFNTRIQLKNDTSANWSSTNLSLLAGEFAWDSAVNNFKIGAGAWNSLNYAIPVADGTTIVSQVGDSKFKTLSIGSIGTDKVTSLAGYSLGSTTYSALATTDTLNQALAKLEAGVNTAATSGVQSIGGATGTVTLGNGLTSTSGANGSVSTLVNGYIVNNAGTNTNALDIDPTKIDSSYVMGNSTNLATIGTVTHAIGTLDGNITGTPGTGKTPVAFSQTDGIVTASFADISITSSQISDLSNSYASDGTVAITGTGVAAALGTLDGSHDVSTAATYTPGDGESATYRLDIFDATETDGIVSTNQTAADTLYFSQAYSASNPILTKADIGSLSGAMHFKGTVNSNSDLPSSGQTSGDVYIVSTAGTYAGQECEVGDMIIWNGSAWNIVTGENQVTPVQGGAELVAGAAATTIGTIDGVTLTAKATVNAGNATIASVTDGVVTLKAGVTQGTGTGTIANSTGTDITLAKVATTGTASDLTVTSANYGGTEATTNAQTALNNLAAAIAEGTNGMLSTSATGQPKTPNGQSMSDDIVLHDIAKTGNTDDLIQGLTILLDCGTATTNTDTPASV